MKKKIITFIKRIITKTTIIIHNSKIKHLPNYNNYYSSNKKIAIQFHIYFIDLLDELFSKLNNISIKYDLYISTDTEDKAQKIKQYFEENKLASVNNIIIEVFENVGRDIYPFFKQMTPRYMNYDIIGHLHTKKSTTSPIGNRWRKYLYNVLLNENYVNNLLSYMNDNKKIGIIAPAPYYEIIFNYFQNLKNINNKRNVITFLSQFNIFDIKLSLHTKYPAGNMFYIRSEAVKQLFERNFSFEDFPKEEGQLDNTTQHTIELIWNYIVEKNNYVYKEIS